VRFSNPQKRIKVCGTSIHYRDCHRSMENWRRNTAQLKWSSEEERDKFNVKIWDRSRKSQGLSY
jgi:hypothetical protein